MLHYRKEITLLRLDSTANSSVSRNPEPQRDLNIFLIRVDDSGERKDSTSYFVVLACNPIHQLIMQI